MLAISSSLPRECSIHRIHQTSHFACIQLLEIDGISRVFSPPRQRGFDFDPDLVSESFLSRARLSPLHHNVSHTRTRSSTFLGAIYQTLRDLEDEVEKRLEYLVVVVLDFLRTPSMSISSDASSMLPLNDAQVQQAAIISQAVYG